MTFHLATAAASQGSTSSSIGPAAVDLAIIVLLLVTRVHGRRLEPARLLAGPLILIAIGIGSSTPELRSTTPDGIDYLIVGLDLLDSLIVGTIRGFTVRRYQRDGAPWYRYGPATVALWLVSILIRVGLAVLGSAHHAAPLAEGSDLLFMLGLALLGQNVVIVRRHVLTQEQRLRPGPTSCRALRDDGLRSGAVAAGVADDDALRGLPGNGDHQGTLGRRLRRGDGDVRQGRRDSSWRPADCPGQRDPGCQCRRAGRPGQLRAGQAVVTTHRALPFLRFPTRLPDASDRL